MGIHRHKEDMGNSRCISLQLHKENLFLFEGQTVDQGTEGWWDDLQSCPAQGPE